MREVVRFRGGPTPLHSHAVGTQWDALLKELLTFEQLAKVWGGCMLHCGLFYPDHFTTMRCDSDSLQPEG